MIISNTVFSQQSIVLSWMSCSSSLLGTSPTTVEQMLVVVICCYGEGQTGVCLVLILFVCLNAILAAGEQVGMISMVSPLPTIVCRQERSCWCWIMIDFLNIRPATDTCFSILYRAYTTWATTGGMTTVDIHFQHEVFQSKKHFLLTSKEADTS